MFYSLCHGGGSLNQIADGGLYSGKIPRQLHRPCVDGTAHSVPLSHRNHMGLVPNRSESSARTALTCSPSACSWFRPDARQALLCGGNGAWRSLVARVLWEH